MTELTKAFVGEDSQQIADYKSQLADILQQCRDLDFKQTANMLHEFRKSKLQGQLKFLDWHRFVSNNNDKNN